MNLEVKKVYRLYSRTFAENLSKIKRTLSAESIWFTDKSFIIFKNFFINHKTHA